MHCSVGVGLISSSMGQSTLLRIGYVLRSNKGLLPWKALHLDLGGKGKAYLHGFCQSDDFEENALTFNELAGPIRYFQKKIKQDIEAVVAKVVKNDVVSVFSRHGMSLDDLFDAFYKFFDLFGGRIVREGYERLDAAIGPSAHIIDSYTGSLGVSDRKAGVVECANSRASKSYVFHGAFFVSNDDPITYSEGPVEQDHYRT